MFKFLFSSGASQKLPNNYSTELHTILSTPLKAPLKKNQEEIYFGCGCFWGAEKGFWKLPGVITTAVGYAGGNSQDPNYQQICRGNTGHAEVVKVVWDITKIDISDLLKMFWDGNPK